MPKQSMLATHLPRIIKLIAVVLLVALPVLLWYNLHLDHQSLDQLSNVAPQLEGVLDRRFTFSIIVAAATSCACLLLLIETHRRQSVEKIAGQQLAEMQRATVVAAHQETLTAILDSEGRVEWCNGRFAQVFTSSASVGRRHISDVMTAVQVPADLLQQICTTLTLSRLHEMDIPVVLREGITAWYNLIIKPLHDREGRMSGQIIMLADITHRRQQHQQLEKLAYFDPGTSLPNRAMLMQILRQQLQRDSDRPALMYIKFPRAASMRGSLGSDLSEELMKAIVARLKEAILPEQTLCRLSGSALAIIAPVKRPAQALAMAYSVQSVLAKPYAVADREIQMVSSIGVSVADSDLRDPAALVSNAEIAMQQVATSSIDEVVLFDVAMRQKMEERHNLESDLRRAIYFDPEQLMLAFQPIMDLRTLDLIGFETLARWKHPVHGFIPPDRFIGVAEQTGMIVPLWNAVFAGSCRQIKRWHKILGPDHPPLFISVNLSSVQFFYPGLLRSIATVIEVTGVEPSWIKFEITESGLMENADAAMQQIDHIKEMGCSLSIDDFGTGYSSLSYLQRLPVDDIKIDRSFVLAMQKAPQNREIVRIVTELGRILKKRVIAEGIETAEDLAILQEMGCEAGQGYYFNKPLFSEPATDVVLGAKAKREGLGPENAPKRDEKGNNIITLK